VTAPDLSHLGPLWLVGCGNMGGALLSRWIGCGLSPESVTIIDPSPKALPAGVPLRITGHPPEGEEPAILVLAVKPQMLGAVAGRLRVRCGAGQLVLSILAGTRTATLKGLFGGCGVVRAMPNTPARLGKGSTALFASDVAADVRATAEALMAAAGHVHWLDDERLFDAVTALSGSGPAYVFRMIEALESAGAALGLPGPLAAALARETVVGAGALVDDCTAPPAVLRAEVTSPGGTTQAGLDALDGDGDLSELIERTLRAAAERSAELGRTP